MRMIEDCQFVRTEIEDQGIGYTDARWGASSTGSTRLTAYDATLWRHGLGLAIVKQIVESHGGQAGVAASKTREVLLFHYPQGPPPRYAIVD